MEIIFCDTNKAIIDALQKLEWPDTVSFVHGNIFEVECDAIVSPANSFGFMDGGIDLYITRHFGQQLEDQVKEYINDSGEILVGEAVVFPTHDKKIPYMFCAPTMRVPLHIHDTVNVYLAVKAVLKELHFGIVEDMFTDSDDETHVIDEVESVCFPGMGTGVGKISPKVFAYQAWKAFDEIINCNYNLPQTIGESKKFHYDLINPK